jgi:hypothetical protein
VLEAQSRSAEYRLKAAVLSKFPEFAAWPDAALGSGSTFNICVATPNPFGTALAELAGGEVVHGRALATRQVARPDDIDRCHVLFLPAMSSASRRAFLSRAATRPTLTVSDTPEFLDDGGIVELRMSEGRVRFAINAAAADRAGLRLSSQLLRLAVDVRGRPS